MRRKQRSKILPTAEDNVTDIDNEISDIDDEIHALLNSESKTSRRSPISNRVTNSAPLAPPIYQTTTSLNSQDDILIHRSVKARSEPKSKPQLQARSEEVKEVEVDDDDDDDDDSQEENNFVDQASSVEAVIAQQKHDLERKKLEEKEKAAATHIKNVFTALTGQLNEFKSRFQEATEKLWSEEDRNAALEEKIESLEEERSTLIEANIKARENAMAGKVYIPIVRVSNEANSIGKDLRGEEIRRALLFDDYEENGVSAADNLYENGATMFASAVIKAFLIKMTPFKNDIRKITSHFGSSVASFFIFYRFIFLQSILIAIIAGIFTVFHILSMIEREFSVKEIIFSNGFLPRFMMYSTFSGSERVYYSAVVISGLFITFFVLIDKYIREDLISKEAEAIENENKFVYGNDCFCAWDFSVISKTEADDYCGNLTQVYCLLLSETKDMGMKDSRSNSDLFSLYSRRFIGFLLYLLVQIISFILIILVTVGESNLAIKQVNSNSGGVLITAMKQLLPSFLLTTINYATPEIFTRITELEQWDNVSTEINMLLFRMFCSSTLNLLLLAFSYALLANPFLLADFPNFRTSLEVRPSRDFLCRMDQAANGLFTLVILSFFFKAAVMMIVPVMNVIKARLTLKTVVKEEFAIAKRIVETLNLISVVFLSFPYAPLSLIFLPFLLYSTLKWEKYTTLKFQSKPRRPWKAQKAGSVFTMFYLISLISIGIPSGIFFLATSTFPKACSLQDVNVRLCLTSELSASNECILNENSPYYDYFTDQKHVYEDYNISYPKGVCENACGPYVDVVGSNMDPIIDAVNSMDVLKGISEALFSYPYIPWGLSFLFLVILCLQRNAVDVLSYHNWFCIRSLQKKIVELELESKRQNKIIGRMRLIEREDDESLKNQIQLMSSAKEVKPFVNNR